MASGMNDNRKLSILYASEYGASESYAKRLASDLGIEAEAAAGSDISSSDIVVLFGGLYAGTMNGLKETVRKLPDKAKLIVVSVGLADPEKPSNAKKIDDVVFRIIPDTLRARTVVFRLRGGMDYSRLSMKHRSMMWMLCRYLERKKERSEEDQAILDTYGTAIDFMDYKTLGPLESYIRELIAPV